MKHLLIGALLATVAMFVWSAVFWISPFPYQALAKAPDDAAAGQHLLAAFPASGTYMVPDPAGDEQTMTRLYAAGPIATVHIQREGRKIMPARQMGLALLHELVVVLLLALLLKMALPALHGYGARVGLIAVAGLAAAVFTHLNSAIWWAHPWPFLLVIALYDWSAFVVAGLVLAAFIKSRPASPPEAA